MFTPHFVSHVTCHMSGVTCHVSCVMFTLKIHFKYTKKTYKITFALDFLELFYKKKAGGCLARAFLKNSVLNK